MSPRLVVEESGKSWVLDLADQAPVTVGRGRKSGVVVTDTKASREHCVVEHDGEGFWVRDLESRNGTRLNGKRIKSRALLRPGDRIEIGKARVIFEDGAALRASADALSRDPDTGLRSYAYVRAELGTKLLHGRVSLVKLDVDALGLLNSVLGFDAGDAVVATVARAVEAAVAAEDASAIVGQESGGRVLVIAPGRDAEEATELAAAIRARVATAARDGELPVPSVTLSAGVASAGKGVSARELLRAAESALAEAKKLGGDRVIVAPDVVSLDLRFIETDHTEEALDTSTGGLAISLEPVLLEPAGQRALALAARVLGSDLDLDGLAEFALGIVAAETKATRGLLVLRDAQGELRLGAAVSPHAPGGAAAPASHGLVRAALDRPLGLLLEDAQADEELGKNESVAATGARSVVAAPISWEGQAIGAIYLENNEGPGRFDRADLDLVRAFGRLVAGPIRRGLLHSKALDELSRARLALAGTLEEDARLLARHRSIVGRSSAVKRLLRSVERAADRPLPVVITGESGTGKELVARALHARSRRSRSPFVAENCAALADELLEAELFGYRKGAFTGADKDKTGLLEAAHEGTLFLDEVGDMSPRLQAKLLRFLQEGELRPLGGDDVRRVNVRVLAATNRDLKTLVERGEMREDLYYRLAVLKIDVPPLRERREDVPLLVEHFASRAAKEIHRAAPRFTPETLAVLAAHGWPGNVRQLENEVRKLVALGLETVGPEHLSSDLLPGGPEQAAATARKADLEVAASSLLRAIAEGRSLEKAVDSVEREILGQTLEATGGNLSETARRLGLSRPGLRGKMRRLGVGGTKPSKKKVKG